MKQRIILRGDGNSSIGFGHIFRLLALSEHLLDKFKILFVTKASGDFILGEIKKTSELISIENEDDFLKILNSDDLVVLDGYTFSEQLRKEIKNIARSLIVIDDIPGSDFITADLIINHTPGIDASEYTVSAKTRLLTGSDYVILRKPFLSGNRVKIKKDIYNIFITFGGADQNNLTSKAIQIALQFPRLKNIYTLINSSHPQKENISDIARKNNKVKLFENLAAEKIRSIICRCNFGIVPSSVSSFETCSLGLPIMAIQTANNQKMVFRFLEKNNLAICIEDPNELYADGFFDKYLNFEKSPVTLEILQKNQMKFFDGKSGERIKNAFIQLCEC